MQNYTENANEDVRLTVENAWYFKFPLRLKYAHVILKKNFCIIPADIACSKSTIELLEQGMKYVQSEEERPQSNITEVTREP